MALTCNQLTFKWYLKVPNDPCAGSAWLDHEITWEVAESGALYAVDQATDLQSTCAPERQGILEQGQPLEATFPDSVLLCSAWATGRWAVFSAVPGPWCSTDHSREAASHTTKALKLWAKTKPLLFNLCQVLCPRGRKADWYKLILNSYKTTWFICILKFRNLNGNYVCTTIIF